MTVLTAGVTSYTTDPGPVARVHRPGRRDFYRRFVRTRTPAIITGLMDDWPAMQTWTPSYLADHLGEGPLPINRQDPEKTLLLGQIGDFVRMPFSEAVKVIEAPDDDKAYYLRAYPFHKAPTLWDDIQIPDICPNWIDLRNSPFFTASRGQVSRALEETLFVGGAGVTTPYHTDGVTTGALLAQVAGSKHCVLVSDDQYQDLYARPLRRHFGLSKVDFRKPDLEAYPRYRNIAAQECVLQPGEILYIPHTCWHGIISQEVTISYSIQILNRANFRQFLMGLAERPLANAYYRSQGGFKRVIGALTWE
jgi:hypothetical protein